jgi:hypothetical protein
MVSENTKFYFFFSRFNTVPKKFVSWRRALGKKMRERERERVAKKKVEKDLMVC